MMWRRVHSRRSVASTTRTIFISVLNQTTSKTLSCKEDGKAWWWDRDQNKHSQPISQPHIWPVESLSTCSVSHWLSGLILGCFLDILLIAYTKGGLVSAYYIRLRHIAPRFWFLGVICLCEALLCCLIHFCVIMIHRVIFRSIRELTNLVKASGAKAKHYNTKDFIW